MAASVSEADKDKEVVEAADIVVPSPYDTDCSVPQEWLLKVKARLNVFLHPSKSAKVQLGIAELLSGLLFRYDESYGGVLLSYFNTRILNNAHKILPLLPYFSVKLETELLLFTPRAGMMMAVEFMMDRTEGRVTRVGKDHIGLLVLEMFSAAISVQDIREDLFFDETFKNGMWVSESDEHHTIGIESRLWFLIKSVQVSDDFLDLTGSLVPQKTGSIEWLACLEGRYSFSKGKEKKSKEVGETSTAIVEGETSAAAVLETTEIKKRKDKKRKRQEVATPTKEDTSGQRDVSTVVKGDTSVRKGDTSSTKKHRKTQEVDTPAKQDTSGKMDATAEVKGDTSVRKGDTSSTKHRIKEEVDTPATSGKLDTPAEGKGDTSVRKGDAKKHRKKQEVNTPAEEGTSGKMDTPAEVKGDTTLDTSSTKKHRKKQEVDTPAKEDTSGKMDTSTEVKGDTSLRKGDSSAAKKHRKRQEVTKEDASGKMDTSAEVKTDTSVRKGDTPSAKQRKRQELDTPAKEDTSVIPGKDASEDASQGKAVKGDASSSKKKRKREEKDTPAKGNLPLNGDTPVGKPKGKKLKEK